MPAYYFYHLQGYKRNLPAGKDWFVKEYANFSSSSEEAKKENEKLDFSTFATIVSLKFAGNSELLEGFYDALENKIID